MMAQPKSQFFTGSGERISLGSEIARGGEGRILNVDEHPEVVAKIYHQPVSQEKALKLTIMVSLKTERLLNLTAWPVDTLHEFVGGPVSGFLMLRITDHKNIHILYGVKSRNAEYPEARWPFLIQSAANVARAFNVVHEHGPVIGDVNHGSIVVSKRATVLLVDCDSFQITAQGHQFLCEVGISTHLPPELQVRDLHGIVRTIDHDSFGLAIIIFQLLFMGRHPFSGTSLSPGDISLETAIKEHRFAYGPGAAARLMRQPPATLNLDAVSPQIAAMFERAFLTDIDRPKPGEWVTALTEMSNDLQKCPLDSAHYFLNSLRQCPWCEIESHSGIILFGKVYIAGSGEFFDLVKTWVDILSVGPPVIPPLSDKPQKDSIFALPSAAFTRERRFKSAFVVGFIPAIATISFFTSLDVIGASLFIGFATVAAAIVIKAITTRTQKQIASLKESANQKWTEVNQLWTKTCSTETFSEAINELNAKKEKYENLANLRYQELDELEKIVWDRSLHDFLSGHRIEQSNLDWLNSSQKAALRSHGVESADDINKRSLHAIEGLKQPELESLIAWRKSLIYEFKLQPKPKVGPEDLKPIEAGILNTKIRIQRELKSAPAHLQQLKQRIVDLSSNLRPEANSALAELAQIDRDLKKCSPRAWIAMAMIVYFCAVGFIAVLKSSPNLTTSAKEPKHALAQPAPLPLPEPPIPNRPEDKNARALFDRGLKLAEAGNKSKAVNAFQQAILLSPNLAGAERELGMSQYELKKYKEARDAFKLATLNDPKDVVAFWGLGQSLMALGEFKDAADAFTRTTQLQPNNTNYYNLGVAYKGSKDYRLALEAFKQAYKLKPTDANSHYEAGLADIELNQPAEATTELIELNSLSPLLAKWLYQEMKQPRTVSPKEFVRPKTQPRR